MEGLNYGPDLFANIDFFHNLREHKNISVQKVSDKSHILKPDDMAKLLKSDKGEPQINKTQINDILGQIITPKNYDKKVMGLFGYVLHHSQKDVKLKNTVAKFTKEYNKLLVSQKTDPRYKFLKKLRSFFLDVKDRIFLKTLIGKVFKGDKQVVKASNLDAIILTRLKELINEEALRAVKTSIKSVQDQQTDLSKQRDKLTRELLKQSNENRIQRELIQKLQSSEKIIPTTITETAERISQEDKILKALRDSRTQGTVASLSGFLGITTASILARIIGNSTATYLSKPHNSTNNIVIGNKKDERDKLIEYIQNQRAIDMERLRNDVEHLREQVDDRNSIKNKRNIDRVKKRLARKKQDIQLINVINRI